MIEIEPVGVPAAVGVKVTEMVQLAPAGRLEGQAVVLGETGRGCDAADRQGAVPVFFKVTVRAALVVATVWLAKVRLVGDKLTAGVDVTCWPAIRAN